MRLPTNEANENVLALRKGLLKCFDYNFVRFLASYDKSCELIF